MTLNFLKKRKRRAGFSFDDMDSGIQNDPWCQWTKVTIQIPEVQSNINELQKKLNEAMQTLSETT